MKLNSFLWYKETQMEKEEGKINKTSKSKKWSQYKQEEI
jgi:hypothetical protein